MKALISPYRLSSRGQVFTLEVPSLNIIVHDRYPVQMACREILKAKPDAAMDKLEVYRKATDDRGDRHDFTVMNIGKEADTAITENDSGGFSRSKYAPMPKTAFSI